MGCQIYPDLLGGVIVDSQPSETNVFTLHLESTLFELHVRATVRARHARAPDARAAPSLAAVRSLGAGSCSGKGGKPWCLTTDMAQAEGVPRRKGDGIGERRARNMSSTQCGEIEAVVKALPRQTKQKHSSDDLS